MTLEFSSQIIFVGALLALLSIFASVVSRKLGAPILLVFLVLGMLAGEDGPGGIHFNDVGLAFVLGNLALAIILLDGGLGTRREAFRVSLKPALSLATVGVIGTAAITGLAVHWILGLPWPESFLVGAIVGSTDAAAVFGLLGSAGIHLKERTSATLEVESGTNDPMAIFLTVILVQLLSQGGALNFSALVTFFILQMGLGMVLGLAGGFCFRWLLLRLELPSSLYPLAVLAAGLSVFGLTSLINGSGFLAVYVFGVIIGNSSLPFSKDIHRFHDGIAWLSQIGMFLMLGLLITPSHMTPVIAPAIAIALVLIFIARPLSVALSLLPFHFPVREQLFISWCGLRGAVPIILALYPSLAGLESTDLVFELVFVVVLVSLILQGWSIAAVARSLRILVPEQNNDPAHFQVVLPSEQGKTLHLYQVISGCKANGMAINRLPAGEGTQTIGIVRDGVFQSAAQKATLEPEDHVMILASEPISAIGALFAPLETLESQQQAQTSFFGEFVISPQATLGDLAEIYGVRVAAQDRQETIGHYLSRHFHNRPVVGDRLSMGHLRFVVRKLDASGISAVGLKLSPPLDQQ